MSGGVLGWDLSPSLCGWCFASGDRMEAGAFELTALGSDLGTLLAEFEQHREGLLSRLQPASEAYEAPIMRKWDSLIDVRKIYSLGAFLEYLAIRDGLPVHEVDLKRVKMLMTGDQWAEKAAVVRAAGRLGVILPPTKAQGREDAADAIGVALEVLNALEPVSAARWLAILRGGLL